MVKKQLFQKKIICDCFQFIWIWFFIAIMKRGAERMRSLSIFILFQPKS